MPKRQTHFEIGPLPLRIRPAAGRDEPAHGALFRLAARHGVSDVGHFTRSIGIPYRSALCGQYVEQIAALAGLDPHPLARCSPVLGEKSKIVTLNGVALWRYDWSHRPRRVCPVCLAEDVELAARTGRDRDTVAYHRSLWDIRSVDRCPVHGVSLRKTCPVCCEPLGWDLGSVARCAKGCDLAIPGAPDAPDTALDGYIAGRLGLGPVETHPLLDQFSYKQMIALCLRLGKIGETHWMRSRPASLDARARRRRLGFAMANDFPRSLLAALDKVIQETAAAKTGTGMPARYGRLYHEFFITHDDEAAALLRRLFRTHAIANGIAWRTEVIATDPAEAKITLTQACKMADASAARARRALEKIGAVAPEKERSRKYALSPAVLERLTRDLVPDFLTRIHAAKALALGKNRFKELLLAGYLESAYVGVTIASVTALLARIAAVCRTRDRPAGTIPITHASQNVRVPLTTAIELVTSQTVPCWLNGDVERSGLAACHVQSAVLARHAGDKRQISMIDAGRLLSLHPTCVQQLVAAGAIKRASAMGLDYPSTLAFAQTHASAALIALAQGSSPRAVINMLAARHIHPAFEPPTCRAAIFYRNDTLTHALRAPIPLSAAPELILDPSGPSPNDSMGAAPTQIPSKPLL